MTALITGASVGIGYELSRVFAENGHDLVLVARNGRQLEKVAAECESIGKIKARVLPRDLSLPDSPRGIFDELTQAGIEVDTLVNNAGFGTHGPFAEIDLDADLRLLQVNIVALTALTKLFCRPMLARRQGRILNVASVAAFMAGPRMATYYASKAYVLHFSHAIANEMSGTGVTVTALCPGPVNTEFQKRAGIAGSRLFKDRAALDPRTVALAGYRGAIRGKRVVFPSLSNRLTATARLLPQRLTTFIAGRLNEVR